MLVCSFPNDMHSTILDWLELLQQITIDPIKIALVELCTRTKRSMDSEQQLTTFASMSKGTSASRREVGRFKGIKVSKTLEE